MVLNIFGRKIKVKKVRNLIEDHRIVGQYNNHLGEIHMDSSLKGEEFMDTLLHEVVHAIMYRMGWAQTQISHNEAEILSENISRGLMENFNIKPKR